MKRAFRGKRLIVREINTVEFFIKLFLSLIGVIVILRKFLDKIWHVSLGLINLVSNKFAIQAITRKVRDNFRQAKHKQQ